MIMKLKLSFLLVVVIICSAVVTVPAKQTDKRNGRVLSKITFIHYRKAHAKPSWAGGNKGDSGGDETLTGDYTYLANEAKWKAKEDVRFNPACNDGLGEGVVLQALALSITEWESAGGDTIGIFGTIIEDSNVTYNGGASRGYNTISFGSYGDSDVIGVTSVWGYFSGKPSRREIIECHMLMNDSYDWGVVDPLVGSTTVMDLQNIFTHELGHWIGMGDLYEAGAAEETMYGYSHAGETSKRDLYYGDSSGITDLYR
jgi:hypothetical protein